MKHKFLLKTMLLLCALIAGSGSAWADEPYYTLDGTTTGGTSAYDSGTLTQTPISWIVEGNTTMNPWRIGGNSLTKQDRKIQSTTAMGVAINKIDLTVGAASSITVHSLTLIVASDDEFSDVIDEVEVAFEANSTITFEPTSGSSWATGAYYKFVFNVSVSGNSNKFVQLTSIDFYEYTGGGNDPSITASDVNIVYSATSGSIAYTINNGVTGGAVTSATVTSSTPSGWLTVTGSNPYSSPIGLSCSANSTASEKSATVQLTYTYNTSETVTKDVTVTQAADPSAFHNISDITALNTSYKVKGTVVATNARGFVIGDGTGYVYYYKGEDAGKSVGNLVSITGSTGTYGQILQFTSLATVATATTSNYDKTPAVTVLDADGIAGYDNSSVYKLSNYVQIEGTLSTTTSGNTTYYDISVVKGNTTKTARISYPTSAQTSALSALVGSTVRVKGYFAGFSSSNFTVMMESVEEVTNPTLTATLTTAVPNYVQGTPEASITAGTLTVGGTNLTNDVTVALEDGASSAFEIYDAANTTWTSSITLSKGEGTLSSTAISVRLKAGKTAGDYEDQINVTSTGATTKNVAVSGSVTTLAVTYDANGADSGTVPTDATAYAYSGTVTVLGNTGGLTKAHYTFDGWNTQNDGEGTNYTADNTFNITANTTLYAKWTASTYTVTLPAADKYGTYTMEPSSPVAYNTEVTLTYTPASGYENYVATWKVNGEGISGNKFNMPDEAVTVTVTLAESFDMTLSNSDIYAAGNATSGYKDWEITDGNNKTWNAHAIKDKHSNNTSSYHFLQIKKNDSNGPYYIQVPEYGRKITKLEMTVSSTSKPMTDGGNTATIFFSASNTTSAIPDPDDGSVASGTGGSTVTIECPSLNLNTGYITASGAVRIWDVKVTYEPIRLNSYGYATYAATTPVNYPADGDFSAWAITSISGENITFSKVTGPVPAGTGVLLMGTAGQAVIPEVPAANTVATAPATNLLTGITTATTVTAGQYYGLSGSSFVPVTAGTVPAGKALLPASALSGSGVKAFTFVFEDDDPTGISTVNGEGLMANDPIYNLAGQRISKMQKGINIVNGKKIMK